MLTLKKSDYFFVVAEIKELINKDRKSTYWIKKQKKL